MTVEQILRDHLTRATDEVLGGPDVDTAVRDGRRRRRSRHLGLAVAAVAVAGAGALGVSALAGDDSTMVRDAPVTSAAPDFVPGTDVDDVLAATVAAHLPSLAAPDDVYPSDTSTDGPLPDADFAAATDWQAVYTLNGGGRLLVLMGRPVPAEPFTCSGCESRDVPGGTVYLDGYETVAPGGEVVVDGDANVDVGGGESNRGVYFVRDDGFQVSALERTAAGAERTFTDDQLAGLVGDERLTFG